MAGSDNDWRAEVQRLWIFGDGQPAFDFDTVISEGHTSRLAIMENPVETGVLVAGRLVTFWNCGVVLEGPIIDGAIGIAIVPEVSEIVAVTTNCIVCPVS